MTQITTLENKIYEVPDEVAQVINESRYKIRYTCATPEVSSGLPFWNTIKFNNGITISIRCKNGYAAYLEYYAYGSMRPKVYAIVSI